MIIIDSKSSFRGFIKVSGTSRNVLIGDMAPNLVYCINWNVCAVTSKY